MKHTTLGSLKFYNVHIKFCENRSYGLEVEVDTDVHTTASCSHKSSLPHTLKEENMFNIDQINKSEDQ
jgi:hypothetical protein